MAYVEDIFRQAATLGGEIDAALKSARGWPVAASMRCAGHG